MLLVLLTFVCIVSSESEYDHVQINDYEWDMAQIVSPPPYWGRRMRTEQTLHVMALGGSNSIGGGLRWPEYLDEQLKDNFPMIPTSCLNKGKHHLADEIEGSLTVLCSRVWDGHCTHSTRHVSL
jgi:hypothetical protein